MPRVRFQVDGLDALLAVVNDFEPKVIRPAVRQGLADAARLIVRSARANLTANKSVRTGLLRKSIGYRIRSYRGGRVLTAVVGPRVDTATGTKPRAFSRVVSLTPGRKPVRVVPAWYAHLVEYGTEPHSLAPGAKRVSGKAGRGLRQTGPMHPGAKPKPYLRPAYEQARAMALALVRRRVAAAVRKANGR